MCFSSRFRLFHWGPLTALGIIKCVTGMTIHCSNMWWPPSSSIGGLLNSICFLSLSGLTLYNFLSASFNGPGFLPLQWTPKNEQDTEFLQWCSICNGHKAPRSHHCRKCGRCVMKMDHHCPWINNCVGWKNQCHFTSFLFYAVCGCAHASVVLACSLYHGIHRVWYQYYGTGLEPVVYLNVYSLVFCVFSLGLAVGVVIAVGMLLFFQVRSIVRNITGIEEWIIEKAEHRQRDDAFIFPYNLGFWKNVKQVINFSGDPVGDGITWEVLDSCDQYTLTKEQLCQKQEKRQRTRIYKIVKASTGYWFPLFSQGLWVCLRPPCTDEPRVALQVNDTVQVTRWKKYWLFGEKINNNEPKTRIRGWFPRQCAVEVIEIKKDE
ncbi:palmitoyltransferase ZDHHC6 [Ctenocephalides felis]|uniref:palmitoyltransferase ZDHHC6 n=1 Tax=Ctenocephalides felis TaxID=7515 RepID=UPI000E6E484B|nr:palmitoyltransferase ZDHHC6 [Ctenocephalides felis]